MYEKTDQLISLFEIFSQLCKKKKKKLDTETLWVDKQI